MPRNEWDGYKLPKALARFKAEDVDRCADCKYWNGTGECELTGEPRGSGDVACLDFEDIAVDWRQLDLKEIDYEFNPTPEEKKTIVSNTAKVKSISSKMQSELTNLIKSQCSSNTLLQLLTKDELAEEKWSDKETQQVWASVFRQTILGWLIQKQR